jgi:hypothetical protein
MKPFPIDALARALSDSDLIAPDNGWGDVDRPASKEDYS